MGKRPDSTHWYHRGKEIIKKENNARLLITLTGYSYMVTHTSMNSAEQGLTLSNRRDVLLFFWYYDSTLDKFFLSKDTKKEKKSLISPGKIKNEKIGMKVRIWLLLAIIKSILKLLCFLMLNSQILGFIWRGTTYFVVNDKNYFLPGDNDRRASCRTRSTYFWRQIKSLKTQNVKIFPFLNLMFSNYKSFFLSNECLR